MSAPTVEAVSARSLVSDAFYDRLSQRVAKTKSIDLAAAEEITEQALAYLATSAQKPEDAPTLYMSREVDPAWHTFLEFTYEYDRFFKRPGWHKVHHSPCDGFGGATYPSPEEALPPTVEAISAAGYVVRPELWQAAVDCDDTCGDDGGEPDPLPCGDHPK